MNGNISDNEIDRRIGKRLRQRRKDLGISMMALAAVIGVTYQQLQKYESATNRISASRLYKVANALDVSVSYFFRMEDDSAS